MTELDPIAVRDYNAEDQMQVQRLVADQARSHPEIFLRRYANDPRSFGGRYVAADLFKETFAPYAASREARGRYNGPVHNTSAALSAAQFRAAVARGRPGQLAVFVTGIPGAGKTTAILAGGGVPSDVAVIFEGQLSRPETGMAKMQLAVDAGLHLAIVAFHRTPEAALDNTLQRFAELGRGSSARLMAEIQGRLPDGLEVIRRRFPEARFTVRDHRERTGHRALRGWEHLPVLRSEGDVDEVHRRILARLVEGRGSGCVTDAAFQQAHA